MLEDEPIRERSSYQPNAKADAKAEKPAKKGKKAKAEDVAEADA